MKTQLNFKTLLDFTDHFKDETTCIQHLEAVRFRNGDYCPHCNHREIYRFANGKRFRCASCKADFTIRTGTVFSDSKLPIRKWLIAIYLISNSGKGISSYQLAHHIGVTQKTAWFMVHRIRSSMKQDRVELVGTVEVDETYVGGKAKNMHARRRRQVITGTGGTNKTPIFGMKTREGVIKAQVIDQVSRSAIHPILKTGILKKGSTLYSDEHRAYNGLHKRYKHGVVRHGIGEYVVGDCHTNGIESFWSLFKRTYHGVYHYLSRKHLQRYVDEACFRFNSRLLSLQEAFQKTISGMMNCSPLTFKNLIRYEPT